MKWKDLIFYGNIAIEKHKNNPSEELDDFKETVRRFKLLSQTELNRELSKKDEKRVLKLLKKLGIEITELTQDCMLLTY